MTQYVRVDNQGFYDISSGTMVPITDNGNNPWGGADPAIVKKLVSGEIPYETAGTSTEVRKWLKDNTPPPAQYDTIPGQTLKNAPSTGNNSSNNSPSPQQQQAAQLTDQEFEQWLSSQDLSDDEKAAIRSMYNAVGENDMETAERIKKGIEAGTAYSDPYFKAKTALLTDALDRGMNNIDGDMAYNEQSLSNRLADLQKTMAASGDYLSFQHMQELKDLERKYTADLDGLQEDMAARGFTSSSVRTKKNALLNDVYGDLREGSNKAFQYKMDANNQQLTSAQRDTALEKQRLQDLAARGKLDLLRQSEEQLGSKKLGELGYGGQTIGGVGGELPRQQALDAQSFASNYVF